jgi:hypothetical protein
MQALVTALPRTFRTWFSRTLRRAGYQLVNVRKLYEFDGLHTIHTLRFKEDPRFRAAYQRAMQAAEGADQHTEWRVHIGLWAASLAARVPGDFIECGVNSGVLSTAILSYLDWPRLEKTFYLVDTFEGPDLSQLSEAEIESGHVILLKEAIARGGYVTDLERVRRNYGEWPRIEIVQGRVPEILPAVGAQVVAFLHLDMNCAYPEAAALRHFWPSITPGGIVLCDDYAHYRCEAQGRAIDEIVAEVGARIVALPTGQGMIIK